jgi:NAD(P)-dependent dehydrogenase (short-subunit alcohol dehydrogenase family)
MSERLRGQRALITGASRGIGRAIALAFAREGASLALLATKREVLDEVARLSGLDASSCLILQVDVRDREACFKAVEQVERSFGGIDVLVNSAGIYRSRSFLDYSAEDFQALLDVNLFGVLHVMQAVLPGMKAQSKGSIINIASTAGKWGSRNQSAYNVSKHAVVGLTRCVALEVASSGVRVNAICPGFVQTDMVEDLKRGYAQQAGVDIETMMQATLSRIPMGRILEPDEIAPMAVLLASEASQAITGQSILIDGGMLLV